MAAIETRILPELRADGRLVTGLVAPYYTPSQIGDRFIETFRPGSLQVPDPGPALHDGHPPRGIPHEEASMPVSPPGEFAEGDAGGVHGMLGRWHVPPGERGDNLLAEIRAGRKAGLSAGFLPSAEDQWSPDRKQVIRRNSILMHVAACEVGAHPGARVLEVRADAKAPYGDVEYADPGYQEDGKKRYPVDTEEHVRAAWAYISKAHNAGMYSRAELSKIRNRIRAAADHFGIDVETPGRPPGETETRAARRLSGHVAWDRVLRRRILIDAQESAYRTWAGVSDPESAYAELYDRDVRASRTGIFR